MCSDCEALYPIPQVTHLVFGPHSWPRHQGHQEVCGGAVCPGQWPERGPGLTVWSLHTNVVLRRMLQIRRVQLQHSALYTPRDQTRLGRHGGGRHFGHVIDARWLASDMYRTRLKVSERTQHAITWNLRNYSLSIRSPIFWRWAGVIFASFVREGDWYLRTSVIDRTKESWVSTQTLRAPKALAPFYRFCNRT